MYPKCVMIFTRFPPFSPVSSKSQVPTHSTSLNHDMFPHSLSYLISWPFFFILSLIFFWSFWLEGKLSHLGLLRLKPFGPWEDSAEGYLFWSNVDPSLGSLLHLSHQPLLLLDVLRTHQPLLPIPTQLNLSWGYAQTYCCPARGIVFGLSRMGMVGMKGVVGGSEGRRGDWGEWL